MYLILGFIVIGMVSGWCAHLILERNRALEWPRLFVAGVAGSFLGGSMGSWIAGDGFALRPSGLIGSLLGAVIVLATMNALGSHAKPVVAVNRSGTTKSKKKRNKRH